jgi:hypothetical protein
MAATSDRLTPMQRLLLRICRAHSYRSLVRIYKRRRPDDTPSLCALLVGAPFREMGRHRAGNAMIQRARLHAADNYQQLLQVRLATGLTLGFDETVRELFSRRFPHTAFEVASAWSPDGMMCVRLPCCFARRSTGAADQMLSLAKRFISNADDRYYVSLLRNASLDDNE